MGEVALRSDDETPTTRRRRDGGQNHECRGQGAGGIGESRAHGEDRDREGRTGRHAAEHPGDLGQRYRHLKPQFVRMRAPVMFNLRTDPFEFAHITSNTYNQWMFEHAYLIYAVQAVAGKFAETFKDFPSVQKPNTFTIDDVMRKMSEAASGTTGGGRGG